MADREESTKAAPTAAPIASFDLNSAVNQAGPLEVSVSTPESLDDAKHRRWKDKVMFCVGVGLLLSIIALCVGMIVWGTLTPEEKKLWLGVLASIGTGCIGYALGKK